MSQPRNDKTNQGQLKHTLMNDTFKDIEKLESDLWDAADLAVKIQANFEELGI